MILLLSPHNPLQSFLSTIMPHKVAVCQQLVRPSSVKSSEDAFRKARLFQVFVSVFSKVLNIQVICPPTNAYLHSLYCVAADAEHHELEL